MYHSLDNCDNRTIPFQQGICHHIIILTKYDVCCINKLRVQILYDIRVSTKRVGGGPQIHFRHQR